MSVRTYGKIYLDEDKTHWKINNAEPHVCIKLKAVFAKLSASATQPFTFDNTPEVCQDLLWFTDRYPLAISEADMALMKREKKKQLIGRVDRDGQKEQVTVIYLVSDYGSDPLIIDMLGVKSSQSHNIINPLTPVAEQYSDDSRLKLLAEKFLSKKDGNDNKSEN